MARAYGRYRTKPEITKNTVTPAFSTLASGATTPRWRLVAWPTWNASTESAANARNPSSASSRNAGRAWSSARIRSERLQVVREQVDRREQQLDHQRREDQQH